MVKSKKREKFEGFIKLKVYKNSRNGQSLVILPKRKLKKIPKKIWVKW